MSALSIKPPVSQPFETIRGKDVDDALVGFLLEHPSSNTEPGQATRTRGVPRSSRPSGPFHEFFKAGAAADPVECNQDCLVVSLEQRQRRIPRCRPRGVVGSAGTFSISRLLSAGRPGGDVLSEGLSCTLGVSSTDSRPPDSVSLTSSSGNIALLSRLRTDR